MYPSNVQLIHTLLIVVFRADPTRRKLEQHPFHEEKKEQKQNKSPEPTLKTLPCQGMKEGGNAIFFFNNEEPLCSYSRQSKEKLVPGLGFFHSFKKYFKGRFLSYVVKFLSSMVKWKPGFQDPPFKKKREFFSFAIKANTAGGLCL